MVESRGWLSPPRAPRTVRESLDSYGSQHPAIRIEKPPVGKEPWRTSDHTGQPRSGTLRSLPKAFELALGPVCQMVIDQPQRRVEG
jgi:hypothetical protein